jgi:hypothetical protein
MTTAYGCPWTRIERGSSVIIREVVDPREVISHEITSWSWYDSVCGFSNIIGTDLFEELNAKINISMSLLAQLVFYVIYEPTKKCPPILRFTVIIINMS